MSQANMAQPGWLPQREGPPFTPRYTPEQRALVIRLIVDDGHTAKQAIALAKQGAQGVDPYEMRLATAQHLAWKERRRRRRHNTEALAMTNPWQAIRNMRDQLVTMASELVNDLQREPAGPSHLRNTVKAVQAIASLNRQLEGAPAPDDNDEHQHEAVDELSQRLEQALAASN